MKVRAISFGAVLVLLSLLTIVECKIRSPSIVPKEGFSKLHKPLSVPQSFDCKARALAYQYGQLLQPNKNLSTVSDALQLQTLCGYNVDDLTFTYPKENQYKEIEPRGKIFIVDSENGDDGNVGSYKSPFRTVHKALEISRKIGGANTIYFRGGIHYLDQPIELGSSDSGLLLSSYPSEVAQLNGGIPLKVKWTSYNTSGPGVSVYNGENNVDGEASWMNDTDTIKFLGLKNTTDQCQAACLSYNAGGQLCRSFTFHQPNLNNSWHNQCFGRTDYDWAPLVQQNVTSGRIFNMNIWVADLTGQKIDKIHGLQINGQRAVRARFPNADPETAIFPEGWWTGGASSWKKPLSYPPSITVLTSSPERDDILEFQQYSVGVGGTCSIFSPDESFWCSEYRSGGGASYFQVPSGMTLLPNTTVNTWKDPTKSIIHMWQVYHWELWFFEVGTWAASNMSLSWTKGGYQGARGLVDTSNPRGGEWYIDGVFEELDTPNEFFYDEKTNKLYYFNNNTATQPPAANLTFAASNQTVLISVLGTKEDPVKDITIANLQLQNTAYTYMEPHGIPSGGDWALQRTAALFVEGVDGIAITGNLFNKLDGNALMLSGYVRNAVIEENEFAWIGDSAMLSWGYTDGIDGTSGDQPRGTQVLSNIVREIGMFQKQSSAWFQAKSALTYIKNNIFFNGPRAGINFNDGFGGGNEIAENLLFNQCRESSDHGPFNSWDRLPFLTDVPGNITLTPLYNDIHHNFFICNYGSSMCVDNDDGSSYYKIHDNFEVYGGHKSDFGGHNKFTYNSVVAYAQCYDEGLCGDFNDVVPNYADGYWNNSCIQGALIPYLDISGDPSNITQSLLPILYNNRVYNAYANLSVNVGDSTLTEDEWQALGQDKNTQVFPMPTDDEIIAWGKAVLQM
eukprot:TRINITY_DN2973_c0_g1_i5.p1 TRINITY_DN2973_c0_g1~~TRINITY_DN2973_c0_g1_i5.p1  ORF type:complete len:905 (+),score=191.36 TRINITY_DN2973_c0_g1_i5:344-3058(+)